MHYHTGLAYETTDEFVAGAVPFVDAAVAQEHAVIAILSAEKADALREAASGSAHAIEFAPMEQWYVSQARAFSKFIVRARALQEAGGRGLCILSDPSAAGLDEEQVRRWVFMENAVNDVLRDMSMSVMCAYDLHASGLTRAQIEISHPHMATGEQVQASSAFIEPRDFNESAYTVPRSDMPSDARALGFDASSLAALRAFVDRSALDLGLSAHKAADFVIAVSEAAGNAVEHGGGGGIARMCRSGAEVVCDISSMNGQIASGTTGFATPEWIVERGRGIWMMRQLCDWVDVRADGAGTSVRLHMRG